MIAFASFLSSARAQDRVVLRGTTTGKMTVTGVVAEYTGTKLTILSAVGMSTRTYDAADVLEVQSPQVEQHQRALKSLEAGQVESALRDLDAALRVEDRLWMRREILAEMVRAAVRINDYGSAGLRFKALYESDSTTRHFNRIPLVWAPQELTASAKAEARDWIGRDEVVLKLIAGSLLLDEIAEAEVAEKTLRELASHTDSRIRWLAQAQLWRLTLKKGPPGDKVVESWADAVDDLPQTLRAGPKFLLGRAYAARREQELAAAAFLWLPLVDDTDRRLAARACLHAAEALADSGRLVEAQNILAELRHRYPDTAFAAEAEERLKEK